MLSCIKTCSSATVTVKMLCLQAFYNSFQPVNVKTCRLQSTRFKTNSRESEKHRKKVNKGTDWKPGLEDSVRSLYFGALPKKIKTCMNKKRRKTVWFGEEIDKFSTKIAIYTSGSWTRVPLSLWPYTQSKPCLWNTLLQSLPTGMLQDLLEVHLGSKTSPLHRYQGPV